MSQDFEFPAGASGSDIPLEFSDSSEVSVSIPIIDDDSAEGEKQFTVGLLVYDRLIDVININIADDDGMGKIIG